jgi:hypothetical protein
MGATLVVRHSVSDFAAWKSVYDEVGTLRAQHGCTADRVWQAPGDANDVFILHDFPSLAQAEAFAHDENLKAAMMRGGVSAPPRIEIFTEA